MVLLVTVLILGFATFQRNPQATCHGLSSDPSSPLDLNNFLSVKYDYLIIGGGTAGMTLAARLAEVATFNVGVIEAGVLHEDDPNVDIPGFSGRAIGNPLYDWNFVSTPQENAGNRNIPLPRGKMLGGSSGLNGLAWGRASAPEYDAWGAITQDTKLNWNEILPYFKKTESIALKPANPYPGITRAAADRAAQNSPNVDGFAGPISGSHNSFYFDVVPTVVETLNSMGFDTNAQPEGGNATGISNTYASVDQAKSTRSYSAPAYYCQQPFRKNLRVLTGAQATKITLSGNSNKLVATGVQFMVDSKIHSAAVKREVILAAGTVQTPQILELSGIGNSSILRAHGVDPLVDLPSVGENFQEHLFVGVQWLLKPGVNTFDILRNNLTFATEQLALYNDSGQGLWAQLDSTVAFIPLQSFINASRLDALLKTFDQEAMNVERSSLQALQYPIQKSWIEKGNVAHCELIQWSRGFIDVQVNQSYVVLLGGISHPTSRGNTHITSNDPVAPPNINPRFLSHEFDAMVQLDLLKFIQKIGQKPPFSEFIDVQTSPSPSNQSDDDLLNYLRQTSAGGDHLIGTAAMAPREQGGVVDSNFHVYGTENVRVVDASIFPLHIAAHTQATVYAIAEMAAQMIKETGQD